MAKPLTKTKKSKGKAGFDGVRNVCIQEVIWVPVGKPPGLARRWKYTEPMGKAEAKDRNLVGTSEGWLGQILLSLPLFVDLHDEHRKGGN